MPDNIKRILIVENDIDTLSLIYTTLLPFDYALEAAIDASELKLRFERFEPDLVLLGISLAVLNGQDLCEWIKKNYQVRVIGIGNPAKSSWAGQQCMDDILEKPVCPQKLLAKLSNMLPA